VEFDEKKNQIISHSMNPYSTPTNDPNQAPDSRAEKINALWKIVSLAYTLGVLGLILFWEFNDMALPLLVREWQGAILQDSYYPTLDILLSLLILLIPLLIAKIIVEKVAGVKIITKKYPFQR